MKKLLLSLVVALLNVVAVNAQWNPVVRVSYTLPETITIEVGQTVDLRDYLSIYPETATLSSSAKWDYSNGASYIKVENNKLTGLATTGGVYLALQIPMASSQLESQTVYMEAAHTTVIVKEVTPTAINIKNDHLKITVGIGETEKLTKFLKEAWTFTPSNAKGKVEWTPANKGIVEPQGYWAVGQTYEYNYAPVKVGTTTMTAYLSSNDIFGTVGRETEPTLVSTQKVTVTVIKKVTDILINPALNLHECNVGDDLTLYLKAITQVLPSDAPDKSVKWSVVRGDNDVITISNNGTTVKAVKAGIAYLQVTSVSNPEVYNIIGVQVHNPAKDVKFAQDVVNVDYQGSTVDISQLLKDNIQFQPSDFESIDELSIKSDREDLVKISQASFNEKDRKFSLTAHALGSGDATITVSFLYYDYIDGGRVVGSSIPTYKINKSFKVHIGVNVTAIIINNNNKQEDCNVGDDLTSYLNGIIKVLPDNAPDKSVTWEVLRGDAVTIDKQGNIKAVKAGLATLEVTSVSNPQVSAMVTVQVHNPAKDIQLKSNTISVDFVDKPIDISNDIRENLSFLPTDFESVSGFTLTSDNIYLNYRYLRGDNWCRSLSPLVTLISGSLSRVNWAT